MIAFYEDNTGSTGNSGMGAVAAANRVFLLRWLRLLFGREFHQEDVLVIWDSLFTVVSRLDQPNCLTQLVESFAVAMVLFVRPALIEYTDMHQCLRRLMKFPPVEDVTVLVETACDLLFLAPEERMRVGFVSSRGEVLCHQTAPSPPATAAAVSVLTDCHLSRIRRIENSHQAHRANELARATEIWKRQREAEP
jgi:hypothetical protein